MADVPNPNPGSSEVVSGEASAQEVMNGVDHADQESQEIEHLELDAEKASEEELEEVLEDNSASDQEKKQAAKELKKRLKLKVNGREIEEEIDFNDDDKLRELLQKGYAADSKFQEAAGLKKQMQAFVQLMQQDPIQALQKLGHDPDKIAEMHMQKRIEEMQKSPEQIAQEKMQKELEALKAEKELLEKEKFDAEQKRVQDQYARQLDEEITSGLKNSELPKSPYVVKRIAELMMLGLSKNKNISVQDVLPIAEKQIKGEIQQMFAAMPEEIIEKILGQDVSNKLRKRRLNKMKKSVETASQVKQTGKAEINANKAKETVKPVNSKDFFKKIGSY